MPDELYVTVLNSLSMVIYWLVATQSIDACTEHLSGFPILKARSSYCHSNLSKESLILKVGNRQPGIGYYTSKAKINVEFLLTYATTRGINVVMAVVLIEEENALNPPPGKEASNSRSRHSCTT
jgi:hypothetical protein